MRNRCGYSQRPVHSPTASSGLPAVHDSLVHDNVAMLDQGCRLVESITTEHFTRRSQLTLGASIGGHLRHNLDHYAGFLRGIAIGRVDYDDRARDEGVETIPERALATMREMRDALLRVDAMSLEREIDVRMDTGESECRPWTRSTGRRELQFLLSHTVHHYALVAMICRIEGVELERDFGVAPSTIKHRKVSASGPVANGEHDGEKTCAR